MVGQLHFPNLAAISVDSSVATLFSGRNSKHLVIHQKQCLEDVMNDCFERRESAARVSRSASPDACGIRSVVCQQCIIGPRGFACTDSTIVTMNCASSLASEAVRLDFLHLQHNDRFIYRNLTA